MIILGTNSIKDTGYDVANSCRLNQADTAYMHKTPSSSGSQRTFTFSTWWKQGDLGSSSVIFSSGEADGDPNFAIYYSSSQKLNVLYYEGSSLLQLVTNAQYRDPSAWYHICVAIDTTQGTNTNRAKIYINGSQVTSLGTATYCNQNVDISINTNSYRMAIGAGVGNGDVADGYAAETVLIDGTQLAADSFGEFDSDSGIWKPIDVSGLTFGTNGFYLDFEDSSNLGNDANGGTDLTEVNLAATDQSTDTCTNNFATLNPLEPSPNAITFSEGNLVEVGSGGNGGRFVGGTIAVSSGKWWCEIKVTVNGSYPIIGIIDSRSYFKMQSDYFVEGSQTAQNRSGYAAFTNADVYNNGDNNFGSWETYGNGDIIGLGIDMDAGTPTFTLQKNGGDEKTFTAEVPPSGFYTFPAIGGYYASAKAEVNFGNPPYAISSGNTDGEGFGNFEFAVKSGYFALCTKNLAEYG
jgi:hypothetical protein